jgi:aldehyde dehydrogenase (NAD+)
MRYAGQKCTATSRAVVARKVEEAFLDRLRGKIEALPLGPVEDPAAAVGPLINEEAAASIRGALGRERGERIWGGVLPNDDRFRRGFYSAPAIVRQPEPDSEIAREELFGPVLATFSAEDLEHAITLANKTSYGLSASIFTRDLGNAFRFIRRIEAGLVRVNGDTTGVDPHAPFGGMKGSSSGSREQGPAARDFYTEIKTVQINP